MGRAEAKYTPSLEQIEKMKIKIRKENEGIVNSSAFPYVHRKDYCPRICRIGTNHFAWQKGSE